MILTEDEEKMIEAFHLLRSLNYPRYHGWITAMTPAILSEVKLYSESISSENGIIQFPGTE